MMGTDSYTYQVTRDPFEKTNVTGFLLPLIWVASQKKTANSSGVRGMRGFLGVA
jgi:hypothetical protein